MRSDSDTGRDMARHATTMRYRFATASLGKTGQPVASAAGIHARQVAVSGQVARNPRPEGLGSGWLVGEYREHVRDPFSLIECADSQPRMQETKRRLRQGELAHVCHLGFDFV